MAGLGSRGKHCGDFKIEDRVAGSEYTPELGLQFFGPLPTISRTVLPKWSAGGRPFIAASISLMARYRSSESRMQSPAVEELKNEANSFSGSEKASGHANGNGRVVRTAAISGIGVFAAPDLQGLRSDFRESPGSTEMEENARRAFNYAVK
jgi:hypothetical protein